MSCGNGSSGSGSSSGDVYIAHEAISSSWYPSYCPDTPLQEIGRKAAEEKAEAMKYQHIWQAVKQRENQCCDLPPLEEGLKEPPPPPAEYLPEPDPWPEKIQKLRWCQSLAKYQCPHPNEAQAQEAGAERQADPANDNSSSSSDETTSQNSPPAPESSDDGNANNIPADCCEQPASSPSNPIQDCEKPKDCCEQPKKPNAPPNPDCERLKEVVAMCDEQLGLKPKEPESPKPRRPTACDFARIGGAYAECQEGGPPSERECEKFMSFAKGKQPRMQLYDPRNRDRVEQGFKDVLDTCKSLKAECFSLWSKKERDGGDDEDKDKGFDCRCFEEVGSEDRVKQVPPGCCDYRQLDHLKDHFEPPAFDINCPPMPTNVPKLCMPGWLECPPEITVPPYSPPPGAKIKPISKGIRTNFERNPTCHKCGAKRKKPKPDVAIKNAPALKEPCSSKLQQVAGSCCGQSGNAIMEQIKNLRKMIGF